jgi:hypothetical protein
MGKASFMADPSKPSEERMSTDLDTRIKILGQLYINRQKFSKAQDMFDANDVGIPYAFLVASGITIMMEESSNYIKDSWLSVCNYLSIDPTGKYEDLNQILDVYILSKKVKEEEIE